MKKGHVLCVTKLDRLGRDAIDVSMTISRLRWGQSTLFCAWWSRFNKSAAKMTVGMFNAVAQFERDLLIERKKSGLARVKSNAKKLGQHKIFSELQIE